MIEKTLDRDASPGKNRLPAKNFRILRYDAAQDKKNIAGNQPSQNGFDPAIGLSALNGEPSSLDRKPLTMHETSSCSGGCVSRKSVARRVACERL
jgi:hypothetical protein